ARRQLDQDWTDLLTSFDYHDANLRFLIEKFKLAATASRMADLDQTAIDRIPKDARVWVRRLSDQYHAMQQTLRAAEPHHVDNVLQLANVAWRRSLKENERQRLRDFYADSRSQGKLDHVAAIRALLVRVLVAPEFLYRAEPT